MIWVAITAKFSGNVYVGGDLLVGGQGVLSVFQYISTGDALNADGWSNLGSYEIGGTVFFWSLSAYGAGSGTFHYYESDADCRSNGKIYL